MIARMWHGSTRPADADRYVAHLRHTVIPELSSIAGYRGIQVLRRVQGERVEFLVMTLWESMDAIRGFAGQDIDVAVVTREAQALLSDYDRHAAHYEVPLSL